MMHPFIRFLKDHPHCTKPTCSTCGGLLAFQWQVLHWAEEEEIELTDILKSLTIEDLETVNEWPAYLSRVLLFISSSQFQDSILPEWRKSANKSAIFQKFLLLNSPPNAYTHDLDRDWVSACLSSELRYFTMKDLSTVEKFLGDQVDHFPQIQDRQRDLKKAFQYEVERNRQREEERKKQLEAEEQAWKQELSQLEQMEPIDRLYAILINLTRPLDDFPDEWVKIPDEKLHGMNSNQLTGLLRLFDGRISRRKKGPWKDLRSRIYQIRQKVYNQEKRSHNL